MKKRTLSNEKMLDEFVSRLVTEKGLESLDGEVLTQLKADLKDRLEERVNAVVLEKLPPGCLEEFEHILDNGDEKEIQLFCQKNIFDLDQAIAVELLNFRQTYLNI